MRHGSALRFRSVLVFPDFQIAPMLTMCVVMVVVMIESTGMFLALGEMTGKKIGPAWS